MKKLLFLALMMFVFVGAGSQSFAQGTALGSAQNVKIEGTGMVVDEIVTEKVVQERNKKNVLEFFQLLMGDQDYDAAEKYMGKYVQHDPVVRGNGMTPLKKYLTTSPKFKDRPKGVTIKYDLVMAEGDYVYIQKRTDLPGKKMMVQHVFLLNDEGKIDEHWTTVSVVDTSKGINSNPLY